MNFYSDDEKVFKKMKGLNFKNLYSEELEFKNFNIKIFKNKHGALLVRLGKPKHWLERVCFKFYYNKIISMILEKAEESNYNVIIIEGYFPKLLDGFRFLSDEKKEFLKKNDIFELNKDRIRIIKEKDENYLETIVKKKENINKFLIEKEKEEITFHYQYDHDYYGSYSRKKLVVQFHEKTMPFETEFDNGVVVFKTNEYDGIVVDEDYGTFKNNMEVLLEKVRKQMKLKNLINSPKDNFEFYFNRNMKLISEETKNNLYGLLRKNYEPDAINSFFQNPYRYISQIAQFGEVFVLKIDDLIYVLGTDNEVESFKTESEDVKEYFQKHCENYIRKTLKDGLEDELSKIDKTVEEIKMKEMTETQKKKVKIG